MNAKKILTLGLASVLGMSFMAGCGKKAEENNSASETSAIPSDAYVFVAKDMQNTYMQKVYEGFEKACAEIGASAYYTGPKSATAEKQIEIIDRLVEDGVAGIAIAANDADALEPSLKNAMNAGIKVISLDSAVNQNSRQTHIQQADPQKIAECLLSSAYDLVNGKGGIAILSSTEYATNQNLWIECMEKELENNSAKYAGMPLVKIVYGDDDSTKSASETQALLQNPEVGVIIAPTTIGLRAAAKVIQDQESPVKLTGLGLPSEMSTYIESNICPSMYLWNPIDIGYLAGYTVDALVNDEITGENGGSFTAGSLGIKTVTPSTDGGTEIILGEPFKFDISNIAEWKVVY